MLEQAGEFGVVHEEKRVEHLARTADGFTVEADTTTGRASASARAGRPAAAATSAPLRGAPPPRRLRWHWRRG